MQQPNPNSSSSPACNWPPSSASSTPPLVYGWSPYYNPYNHIPTLTGSPAVVPVSSTTSPQTGVYPPMMFLPYPNPYYPLPLPSTSPAPAQDVKAIERHISALLGRVHISNPPSDPPSTESGSPAAQSSASVLREIESDAVEEPALPPEKEYHPPPPRRRLPDLPRAGVLRHLSGDMIQLFNRLRPPPTDMAKRQELLQRLQRIVSSHFREHRAELHLFGSSANDFCLRNADMDICFVADEAAGTREEIVEAIGKLLKESSTVRNRLSKVYDILRDLHLENFKNIVTLPRARVPIAKFTDDVSGISCDICINNVLALSNTRLLSDYAKLDPRVRQLGYVIKHWAKKRAINEPYHGTLSSYALLLMLINFLQLRRPPVLPCLQQMKDETGPHNKVIVEGFDCTYYTNIQRLLSFGSRNAESIGELLAAFFRFYSHEFDWNNQVVSVRTGQLLTKSEKEWAKHLAKDKSFFALEDPFEITHNLGRVVDRNTLKAIRAEFARAFRILTRGGDLEEICHPFVPFNEHNKSQLKEEK